MYLLGNYRITGFSIAYYSIQLFTLLLAAALVEDLLIRGLIIRVLENWIGTYLTLVIAIFLELLHLFNPHSSMVTGVMNLAWGFTMAMLYIATKRIWLPYCFHVGWNFAQPFYGSILTGKDDMGSIFQASFTGPDIITGGHFGIEGSVFTILILLSIGCGCFYYAVKKDRIVMRK